MITARSTPPESGFAARLAAKAGRLAEARAEARRRAADADPWRWRKPALLWPLFTGER